MNPEPPRVSANDTKFPVENLLRFGKSLLLGAGLAEDRARAVAEVLTEGDLLGHTTHGLALLPRYLDALEKNLMEKTGEPVVVADRGCALTWDGRYLPGPWLVRQSIDAAQKRLREYPVVTVVIRRSHHIGCLQAYLRPVTEAGFVILLSCADPDSQTVTPYGGATPRFSTNPIAAGIPTEGDPMVIDMSTASTSHNTCRRFAVAGERLPGPWVVDRNGEVSDDPNIFLEQGGAILPLGGMDLGYKGFALALVVEALTNALGGHGRADNVSRWDASVFLQLIDPAGFGGRAAFLRETSFLARSCRETPAAPGKPPVRLPGQAALARRAAQLERGVELYPTIMPSLLPWAEKLKVAVPGGLN
jgi:LDH2 family malate/lactate/ureidoglycolate dehydrogenase